MVSDDKVENQTGASVGSNELLLRSLSDGSGLRTHYYGNNINHQPEGLELLSLDLHIIEGIH